MTKEEFIQDFKERVVDGVYYNLPKEYRKSNAYSEMSLEDKYKQALSHSSIEEVIEDIIGSYYNEDDE